MKSKTIAMLAGVAVLTFLPTSMGTAQAATPKKFANCTELNKVYKGGVAMKGAKDKRAKGKAKYKPYVNNALYAANKKMDRDKDKIACEK